jgi:hypothetical protein
MKMRTKIIAALSFIIVLAVSAGFFLYHKPADRVVSDEPHYTVNASTLFQEFTKDEQDATTKYLDKVIQVRGRILEISAVDSVGLNIVLETGSPLFGVSCRFSDGVKRMSYRKGEEVTINGLCTGKLMDVVLIKCAFDK